MLACRSGGALALVLAHLVVVSPARGDAPPVYVGEWCPEGSGPGQCHWARGIATDRQGHVYVADTGNDRVQKFDSEGRFLLAWGDSTGSEPGQFDYPLSIASDTEGYLYVVDLRNHRVQKFAGSGSFVTQWSTIQSGDELDAPFAVTVSRTGIVYVSQTEQDLRIEMYARDGRFLGQWGPAGVLPGEVDSPIALTTDAAGNVYISDTSPSSGLDDHVSKFTGDGVFVTRWGVRGTAPGTFRTPYGLGFDSSGDLYVVDHHNFRIQKFTAGGQFLLVWGRFGDGPGEFASSHALAVDPRDNIYILDFTGHPEQGYVQKYSGRPTALQPAAWSRVRTLFR